MIDSTKFKFQLFVNLMTKITYIKMQTTNKLFRQVSRLQ